MNGAVRQKHKAPAFMLRDRRDPRKLLRRRKLVGTQYSKLIASDGGSPASPDLRTYSRQLRLDFAIPDHGRDAMLVPASATMHFVGIAQEWLRPCDYGQNRCRLAEKRPQFRELLFSDSPHAAQVVCVLEWPRIHDSAGRHGPNTRHA